MKMIMLKKILRLLINEEDKNSKDDTDNDDNEG